MDLKSYHFSKRLVIKAINVADVFKVKLHSPFEMVLEIAPDKFIFLFNFGSIVCYNLDTEELDKYLKILCERLELQRNSYKYDDLNIEIQEGIEATHKIDFSKITLKSFSFEQLRILALLIGESVALDHHQSATTELLDQAKVITEELRLRGRVGKSHKELLQFIGACLSTKQNIVDDLYIFDEPDETWDDVNISRLFEDLRRQLELQSRFKSIDYDLDLIQDTAEVLADLTMSRKQNALEITIIALIAFEVLWTLFGKH